MSSPDAIALLHELVSIESVSRNEHAIANFLEGWLSDHGVTTRRIDDNVIATVEGAEPGETFLLNSHLDTVAAVAGWESDPWTPFLDAGRLVGLGSGDAKASVAAMACAAVELSKRGLARGRLMFAATVMEEVGRGGMDVIRPQLGEIAAGMVGEPTSLEAATAQGGLLLIEATAKGRAAHAARAHLGINALTVAARDLIKLDTFRLDRVHPQLGPTTIVATVIKGGERHNVVPDRCEFTLDIRTNPAYEHEEIFEILQGELESELRVRSKRLRPVETPGAGKLIQSLNAAHPDELVIFGSPTMSDWAHLRDLEGVKFGPGDSQRSHTANESVNIDQVRAAVGIYAGCAERYLTLEEIS